MITWQDLAYQGEYGVASTAKQIEIIGTHMPVLWNVKKEGIKIKISG